MRNIYKGPVRGVVVSKLEISDGAIKTMEYSTPVVKKDLLFYRSRLNCFISFDLETVMPDKNEAVDYVRRTALERNITDEPFPCCTYVNPYEIKYSHQVDDQEFRLLKKQYRKQRRLTREKKK